MIEKYNLNRTQSMVTGRWVYGWQGHYYFLCGNFVQEALGHAPERIRLTLRPAPFKGSSRLQLLMGQHVALKDHDGEQERTIYAALYSELKKLEADWSTSYMHYLLKEITEHTTQTKHDYIHST